MWLQQQPLFAHLHSPLEINVKPLRPYQQEALTCFLQTKKGTIMHATALGKTITAMEAMKQLDKPTAIIVPTIAILQTVWYRRLREAGWRDIGLFYGVEKNLRPITIFTYQSAIRYPQVLRHFPVKIFDECHHLRAQEYGKLLFYAQNSEYALGLTATIDPYDPKNNAVLRVMPIIHRMPIAKAREQGWVSAIEVYSRPAQMTPQERVRYLEYAEIIGKVASQLGTVDPTVWSMLAKKGNIAARKGLWAMAKRRMLLSNVEDKVPVLYNIIKQHLKDKVLVFSESIQSIEKAQVYLQQHGIHCSLYHSNQNKNMNIQNLRAWASGTFNVLLSCTALEEGIDVPEVSVGILHTSGRTPRKIVQRLGRIIRPQPNKVAHIYVIHVPGTVENGVVSAVQRAVTRVR